MSKTKADQLQINPSNTIDDTRPFVSGTLLSSSYSIEDDLNDLRSVTKANFGTSDYKDLTSRTLQDNSDFIEFSESEPIYKELQYTGNNLTLTTAWEDSTKTELLYSSSYTYTGKNLTQVEIYRARDEKTLRKILTYFGNSLVSVDTTVI